VASSAGRSHVSDEKKIGSIRGGPVHYPDKCEALANSRCEQTGFVGRGGEELITFCDAPILRGPPAYRRSFGKICGSPVPSVFAGNPADKFLPVCSIVTYLRAPSITFGWARKRIGWISWRSQRYRNTIVIRPRDRAPATQLRTIDLGLGGTEIPTAADEHPRNYAATHRERLEFRHAVFGSGSAA